MRERRQARVGTVSGLALLVGGTAVAAVAGGSVFATVLLGLLAAGLGHALLSEIRRQAGRRVPGWGVADTVNAVLLGVWSGGALVMAVLVVPAPVRAVGLVLSVGYAVSCVYFVRERSRAIASLRETAS